MYGEFYFIGVTLMDIKIGGHAQEVGVRWGLLSIDADMGYGYETLRTGK